MTSEFTPRRSVGHRGREITRDPAPDTLAA
jgi:hypothetical protein